MDPRKLQFLRAVLGVDGASALKKAADRATELESAIVPRAIMAWLGVVARSDFEGSIPGVEDSYIDFEKNDAGLYDGTVAIGEGVFPFQNATVFHLAASVAMALGSNNEIDNRLKDVDLVRLGKSIDILAKATFLTKMDLSKGAPGPPHAPKLTGVPLAPVPGIKQKEKAPKDAGGKKPPKPPAEAPKPKHVVPKSKVTIPKAKRPALKSFSMSERQSLRECPDCGLPLIKGGAFTGCVCFKELARYVSLAKSETGLVISFRPEVDDDAVSVILETLGVSDGR